MYSLHSHLRSEKVWCLKNEKDKYKDVLKKEKYVSESQNDNYFDKSV
jgi:hypothetical protein